jgi:hypothetical protein
MASTVTPASCKIIGRKNARKESMKINPAKTGKDALIGPKFIWWTKTMKKVK